MSENDKPTGPAPKDCDAAWILYNELRTRVTAERLGYRDGEETAALDSLYHMFHITRDIINQHGREAQHFARLAREMLNEDIRPFTSRWHREKLRGRLSRQDHRRLFRKALQDLRTKLKNRICEFGKLAGEVLDVETLDVPADQTTSSQFNTDRIWPRQFLGPDGPNNLGNILSQELEFITKRREEVYNLDEEKTYGGLGKASNDQGKSMGLVGLAISGGGIRSATFALGAVQKLAERGILKDVDYMSTVSGGGYLGAFISSQLCLLGVEAKAKTKGAKADVEKLLASGLGEVETKKVRWLRNRSKYLKQGGWLENLKELCGWFVLLGFIGTVVWLFHDGVELFDFVSILLLVPIYFYNVNLMSFHRFYRNRLAKTYTYLDKKRDSPKLSELSRKHNAPYHLVCAAVNLPWSNELELRGRRSDFFVFSPLYCGSILTEYWETKELEKLDPHLDLATAMAISGAAVAPHRGTLASWSIVRPALMLVRLSYWLPNRASIIGPATPDERSHRTERPKHPNNKALDKSGVHSKSPQVADAVIEAPNRKKKYAFPTWRRPSIDYFLREVFGYFDEQRLFINVSDGGHIENLGLYELLRRRCKFIICIDGEHDPKQSCSGLIKASRYALIDMGINIDIDLSELQVEEDGLCQAHFTLGTIDYHRQDDGVREIGYLLYLKLSMTGNERDYILEYRRRNPSFPHEPTVDQFFDEDQFEAYRALGNHVVEDLFQEELGITSKKLVQTPEEQMFKTRRWLKALVKALKPPLPDE